MLVNKAAFWGSGGKPSKHKGFSFQAEAEGGAWSKYLSGSDGMAVQGRAEQARKQGWK